MDAFETLAVSMSVPFRIRADPARVRAAFLTGQIDDAIWPHMQYALAEAPLEMLFAAMLDCAPHEEAVTRHLLDMAHAVGAEERIGRWMRG